MGTQLLMKVTEVYRIDSEKEANGFIDDETAKAAEQGYKLTKVESKYKTKKSKGEIIDEWYVVTIEKNYCE